MTQSPKAPKNVGATTEVKKRTAKPVKPAEAVEAVTVASTSNVEAEKSFLKKLKDIDSQIAVLVSLFKEHKNQYDGISRDSALANNIFKSFGFGEIDGGSKEILDNHQEKLRQNMLKIQREVQDLQMKRLILLSGG